MTSPISVQNSCPYTYLQHLKVYPFPVYSSMLKTGLVTLFTMAAKVRKTNVTMRKISNPVISTDVMGNRNVEVRAVGAWVQAELPSRHQEAVIAAEEEENRVRQIQVEKQKRLLQFQQEVKKRVQHLDRLKKQKALEANYRAAEQERNIVSQSAFSSKDFAKKDTSLVRPVTALSVDKTGKEKGKVINKEGTNGHMFSEHTNQVHQHVRNAKKNLVSRRVVTDKFVPDDLPGGIWKVSRTRDHPSSRYTVDGEEFDILDDDLIEKVKVINNKEYSENKENVDRGREECSEKGGKSVKFDMEDNFDVEHNIDIEHPMNRRPQSATTFSGTEINRNMPILKVPNIYEGVQSEEEKRRAKSQQAMYRRLFMDIEREQVKENLRRQEHRKRIQRLKKEKEEERLKEEQISKQLIEPRDPVTGETSLEAQEREEEERQFIRKTLQEHELKLKKSREMERYIEALRQQLKDKVRWRKIELPPLCCCGESVWDTHPETCANNCIFYKNPREYGRALQGLLDSSEILGL